MWLQTPRWISLLPKYHAVQSEIFNVAVDRQKSQKSLTQSEISMKTALLNAGGTLKLLLGENLSRRQIRLTNLIQQ
jgi:hypothetical protein